MRRPLLALSGLLFAAADLLAAGCSGDAKNSNWLTYSGVDGHARYFQLAGTPHDPYRAGATTSCEGCHTTGTFTAYSCTDCHVQSQCDTIHVGKVSGYLWVSTSCYGCHRNGLGITPQDHVAQFFPIGDGTKHPAVCTTCHTDPANRSNTAALACATCHRTTGVDARHGAVAGYTAATASPDCVRCHGDGQVNRIADHQASFPIAAGSATHVPACAQCHTAARTDKTWAADFGTFDCLGCHSDQPGLASTHTGLAGYAYASPACLGCHPQGQGHSAFFPIGAGAKHAGIACTDCHTDLANPTVTANFACATCHSADQAAHDSPPSGVGILRVYSNRSSFTTLPWTSPSCLRCHPTSHVDTIASHPSGENTPSNGDHRIRGCLSCHTASQADRSYAANFDTAPGCNHCH